MSEYLVESDAAYKIKAGNIWFFTTSDRIPGLQAWLGDGTPERVFVVCAGMTRAAVSNWADLSPMVNKSFHSLGLER